MKNTIRKIFFAVIGFFASIVVVSAFQVIFIEPIGEELSDSLELPLTIVLGIIGVIVGWILGARVDKKEKKTGTKMFTSEVWLYGIIFFVFVAVIRYYLGYVAMLIVFPLGIVLLKYMKKIKDEK